MAASSIREQVETQQDELWLCHCGFTERQIARLFDLKARYHRDRDVWQERTRERLGFWRWLVEQGVIEP